MRDLPSYKAKGKMPIVITEDDGLCAHDGTMQWNKAEQQVWGVRWARGVDPRLLLHAQHASHCILIASRALTLRS